MINVRHIDTTSSNIGNYEDACQTGAKVLNLLFSSNLIEVAVDFEKSVNTEFQHTMQHTV